ncbi:hypothetical protein [Flavobacterium sp.]
MKRIVATKVQLYNMSRVYDSFMVCISPLGTAHIVATDFNPLL